MPGFNGSRVLSFESRRAQEIAQLIRNNGGIPVVAPSTREVQNPTEEEREVIRRIIDGEFDAVIFTTGVGARAFIESADAIGRREELLSALRTRRIVVRGPKPAAVMREFQIPIAVTAPEPNTWRELINGLDESVARVPLSGCRLAVQEHGRPSSELYQALRERGAEVAPFRVYSWELPEDTGPLKAAIRELADKKIDVVLFTSSVQFVHALRVAQEIGLAEDLFDGLRRAKVASIGPIASETLRENGVRIDLEPSHPKMGFLVKEAAEHLAKLQEGNS